MQEEGVVNGIFMGILIRFHCGNKEVWMSLNGCANLLKFKSSHLKAETVFYPRRTLFFGIEMSQTRLFETDFDNTIAVFNVA